MAAPLKTCAYSGQRGARVASLSAENHHSCVVTSTGGAKCWGPMETVSLVPTTQQQFDSSGSYWLSLGVSRLLLEMSILVSYFGGEPSVGAEQLRSVKDSTVTGPTPVMYIALPLAQLVSQQVLTTPVR